MSGQSWTEHKLNYSLKYSLLKFYEKFNEYDENYLKKIRK